MADEGATPSGTPPASPLPRRIRILAAVFLLIALGAPRCS